MRGSRRPQRWWWLGGCLALACLVLLQLISTRHKLSNSEEGASDAEQARTSWNRLSRFAVSEAAVVKRLYREEAQVLRQAWQGSTTTQHNQHAGQPSTAAAHELALQCQQLLQAVAQRQRAVDTDAHVWEDCGQLFAALLQQHTAVVDDNPIASARQHSQGSLPGELSGKPPGQAPDWPPPEARAGQKERLAVIVPYRDRSDQLAIFASHMHAHLRRKGIPFKVYVAEQLGSDAFNRGLLLNLAALAAEADSDYLALHDVDLLPLPGVSYAFPREHGFLHLSSNISQYDYWLPHPRFTSGVLLISTQLFRAVNGYSNGYGGWGGEDDDFALRLMRHLHGGWPQEPLYGSGDEFPRPAAGQGRFLSLSEGNKPKVASQLANNRQRLQRWQAASCKGPCLEGLMTVADWTKFLRRQQEQELYTLLQFDIPEAVLASNLPEPICSV